MNDFTAISRLFEPLVLPNGQIIPNRIAKAAMEENMADQRHLPGAELLHLYDAWARGGTGLLLTGNVMVAADAVTGPGGVILDSQQPLGPFRKWAEAGKSAGGRIWMQINHPGRQVFAANNPEAIAPSAISMEMGGFSKMFATPRAMGETDIARVIEQFAATSKLAESAGFDGVQIHAAHGYLLSQFLSPITNRRTDQWGGPLENRARILFEIVKAIRALVSPGFALGVKLNSADFQKGGFEPEDALGVVRLLNDLPVDLVEISGGSYESPAMHGAPQKASTRAREAYFIDFARDIQSVATMPIMVTGGIRRRAVAIEALEAEDGRAGVEMIGIAQALAFAPDLPNRWRQEEFAVTLPEIKLKKQGLASLARMGVTKFQLRRMGRGKRPKSEVSPLWALICQQLLTARRNRQYQAWRGARKA
ncbi:MAG: NADH:flavin oxidoreductase/NADH oxidase family protein [Sphingomonadales bacterium]|nr:NADH:flavin oxidoreductase/NADH oxidase family protein [Sphingomonadales bacterium]MBK9003145.1 NADH:flavin oxidoreductase/NADH oxidase family protein [Sphingomonadales bacterium]MBK9268393.1 NADH:flavin oxidoreductase/NADH oxidase family protein [Sphingomonadales bacterium]